MRKAFKSSKNTIKKVSTALFLSVLVFQLNSPVVLALNPTPSQGGAVTPSSYGENQEELIQIQAVNYPSSEGSYKTFNPTSKNDFSNKKPGFVSKLKNKFNSATSFTYSKVNAGVKNVGSWFSNAGNSFNSKSYKYFSITGLATLAGSYLVSKNKNWISSKFHSTKNFLKEKFRARAFSFFSKTKSYLAPLTKSFKNSIRSTSKTLLSSLIPVSTILALQNSSFVRNTRLFRETLATNLSSQLSNWKNATLFPWIQEKTKNKGMAMAIVGIQTTFIVSVGISLMDIGPSVAALALTPEKTISTTINLGVNITKAEVNYGKEVIQNPSKLVEDVKAIPSVAKSLASQTVTQAKDFYHEDSYYKADKLGVVTAQALDLVVGSHGAGKLDKVTKVEEAVIALDKASDVLKTESKVVYVIGEIEKSIKFSPGKGGDSYANALQHWEKHKSDFPQIKNEFEYSEFANNFINSKSENLIIKELSAGRTAVYDPSTNILGFNENGIAASVYKPDPSVHKYKTNLDYVNSLK